MRCNRSGLRVDGFMIHFSCGRVPAELTFRHSLLQSVAWQQDDKERLAIAANSTSGGKAPRKQG